MPDAAGDGDDTFVTVVTVEEALGGVTVVMIIGDIAPMADTQVIVAGFQTKPGAHPPPPEEDGREEAGRQSVTTEQFAQSKLMA